MTNFPSPPEFWSEDRSPELWRLVSQSVRGLLRGKSNNVSSITLLANEVTTELSVETITADTVALMSPKTASASLALSGVYTVSTLGKVTFHHAAAASTDRTYGVVLTG